MKIHEAIFEAFTKLNDEGCVVTSEKWQAITPPDALFEIYNVTLEMDMTESIEALANLTKADLPWAENHFQERVSGYPANPGHEYQNWPYYKPNQHDSSFRAEGGGYFSHTYMERFWPDKNLKGTGVMEYKNGDFGDILQRLKNDRGTRQAFLGIWHPQDQANNGVRLPCTIGYHFLIRDGKLHISYLIRSCDIFRHFKNDIYMTVRLAQYVRDYLDLSLVMGTMTMWIGSLHCFNTEKVLLKDRAIQYK